MINIKNLWKIGVYISNFKWIVSKNWIKESFNSVPEIVKLLILNMSLLWFGWGIWVNMYYSIYLKSLFDNIMLVSILGSVLALIKLFFSIPMGILNNKINSKTILIIWKLLYVCWWILYFLAGILHTPWLVVPAILATWLASPMIFNTNQFLLRRLVPIKFSSKTFWLFFSFYQTGYLIAALIAALLMYLKLPLPYFFLIASVVSLLTLISNTKNNIVDKHWVFYEIKHDILSTKKYKQIFVHLKKHTNWLRTILLMQFLHGLIYYLGFMFIPLLAVVKDFSLVQIALLFAIMRIPHSLTFYLESLFKVKQELNVTLISYLIVAGLLICLAISQDFYIMLWISLLMSFLIATTRPMVAGMITRLINTNEQAEITWMQDFMSRGWEIFGYLIFGVISYYVWLEVWFIGVAILAILLTLYILKKKKFIKFNTN